ncbi:MAG: DNA polymerase III subunit epsilon [Alphaproteobacteria bacterium]|nr:DNA polymerase III subunit epsilon [Alphaproteobacteria bacterium]|tara:strand:+ start:190 stop:855 length:666 start_codon:yes stop_codon:yes gene_type:complete
MREIVVDTETTGLSPSAGHRVIEIGCLELVNHMPTGAVFHEYLNPERDVPAEAVQIHGLTDEFLSSKPLFASVADRFLEFVAGAKLIIHNAEFDLGFLNAELKRLKRGSLTNVVTDTLTLARKKYPGGQASLDALCRRFNIDNSARTQHGALLDAELLAEVYLELIGGRQPGLTLETNTRVMVSAQVAREERPARPHAPSPEELAAHEAFLDSLENPLWRR